MRGYGISCLNTKCRGQAHCHCCARIFGAMAGLFPAEGAVGLSESPKISPASFNNRSFKIWPLLLRSHSGDDNLRKASTSEVWAMVQGFVGKYCIHVLMIERALSHRHQKPGDKDCT